MNDIVVRLALWWDRWTVVCEASAWEFGKKRTTVGLLRSLMMTVPSCWSFCDKTEVISLKNQRSFLLDIFSCIRQIVVFAITESIQLHLAIGFH